jgi:CheY-like chemotaxis protein
LEAQSATEGIALAGEHVPDVILMDLRLPDMDGAACARVLAGDLRTARIPVVALSALPLEHDGDWVAAAGFAGFVSKPISVDELPDQVHAYCAR